MTCPCSSAGACAGSSAGPVCRTPRRSGDGSGRQASAWSRAPGRTPVDNGPAALGTVGSRRPEEADPDPGLDGRGALRTQAGRRGAGLQPEEAGPSLPSSARADRTFTARRAPPAPVPLETRAPAKLPVSKRGPRLGPPPLRQRIASLPERGQTLLSAVDQASMSRLPAAVAAKGSILVSFRSRVPNGQSPVILRISIDYD